MYLCVDMRVCARMRVYMDSLNEAVHNPLCGILSIAFTLAWNKFAGVRPLCSVQGR